MRLLIFFYFLCFFSFSQEFYIQCNDSAIQGGYFDVSFVLKYESNTQNKIEKSSIIPPQFPPNFSGNIDKPQMTNSYQTYTTNINGKKTEKIFHTYSLTYTFKSDKLGDFYIKPATIAIDGKTLKTKEKKITIYEEKKYKEKPIYFEVFTDELDNEIYVGEPIKLTYKISFPSDIEIIDYEWPELVNYTNVWKEEIPMTGEYKEEIINGVRYKSVDIRSVILLYQEEGVYDINEQNFNIQFGTKCNNQDKRNKICQKFQKGYSYIWLKNIVSKNIKTNKLTIKVKELPEEKP